MKQEEDINKELIELMKEKMPEEYDNLISLAIDEMMPENKKIKQYKCANCGKEFLHVKTNDSYVCCSSDCWIEYDKELVKEGSEQYGDSGLSMKDEY